MEKDRDQELHFAVCIKNDGYQASLEVGKLYQVIPDPDAARHGYVRVVDESGEGYGYRASRFFPIDVPEALAKTLAPHTRRVTNPSPLYQEPAKP